MVVGYRDVDRRVVDDGEGDGDTGDTDEDDI